MTGERREVRRRRGGGGSGEKGGEERDEGKRAVSAGELQFTIKIN